MSAGENDAGLLELTTSVISSYVAHNDVPASELAGLIASTYSALAKLGGEPAPPAAAALVPAVPIRKSVTPDAIICLEDGKKFKSLKRHLSSAYGLTPEQYRTKWGLPVDYPMVAPHYAEARSALAKSMGLGRKAAVPAVTVASEKTTAPRAKAARAKVPA
jgi:predicted transcriptional regulator